MNHSLRTDRREAILMLLSFAMLIVSLDQYVVVVALPEIARDLGLFHADASIGRERLRDRIERLSAVWRESLESPWEAKGAGGWSASLLCRVFRGRPCDQPRAAALRARVARTGRGIGVSAVSPLVVALVEGPNLGWLSPWTMGLLLAGAAFAVAFIMIELSIRLAYDRP